MKLSEIISSVRILLDDSQFSADQITQAANWLQNDLFGNTRTRLMESSATMKALAGATTASFPDDMQTMINLYLTDPQVYDMNPFFISYGDFMLQYANFANYPAANVRYWTDFNNGMRFTAPIDVDHTFSVDYVRKPVPMKQTNNVCEIPDQYSEIISRGTLARLMEQNEDYGEASNERQIIAPLITTFIRNEGRGQIKTGPVIMRSNRRKTANDWR